jgi:hypothetical protein
VEELVGRLVSNTTTGDLAECATPVEEGERHAEESRPKEALPPANTQVHLSRNTGNTGKYSELSRALIAAWPSQEDLDIICTLPVGLSAHLFCRVCTPYSSSLERDPPSPREMLQLPPPGSHPVLIARKLLVLGVFLQGVFPSSMLALGEKKGASYRHLMSHVVHTAISCVTTNDELIASVEGIECILMEALYQNYTGNLHRAWMAVRRATAIVQMMALHRGLKSPSLKILDPETRLAFNPDQICFRIAEMDRYLSLMLGLPQASLETRFASPKALEACPHPMERMQRIHCVVSGRILQRNADTNDLAATHEIDALLQRAAAEMPPQWWLAPTFASSSSSSGGNGNVESFFGDTIRLMDQFTHYHLLLRLHLPYILHDDEHSKATAMHVSREMLSRYIVFRMSNPVQYYCRGADFLAFFATTVMCLAHIGSRAQSQTGNVFNALAHSRATDRGMMERSLEIIESMARTDAISAKLTRLIQHLLSIEASAANGTAYSASTLKDDEGEGECDGNLTNGGALQITIPYFGTIKFERGAVSRIDSMTMAMAMAPGPVSSLQPEGAVLMPSVDMVYPGQAEQAGRDYMPVDFGQQQQHFSASELGLGLPPMDSSGDDWSLQGIDLALFDSLFRGMDMDQDQDQDVLDADGVMF